MAQKRLNEKQKMALELMTSGLGLRYKEIAEACGIGVRTLWSWRNDPDYKIFQDELDRINDERWEAITDAARASAMRLVQADNSHFVEYILKNAGYNPTQKVEADISDSVVINVYGDDED